MRLRSLFVLGLAVLLGGASVLLARQWLEGSVREASVTEPRTTMTTVVVAKVPLHFGSQLAEENLRTVSWPADALPPGTFTTLDDVLPQGERRVVLRAIEANEPIMASKISGFGGRASLSAVIADDMRAMTIRVNDIHGVAGFVLPGDRVDIMMTREESANSLQTDILLQNVQVLGIDQDANEKRDKPQVAKAVTLEVTPEQAQKLTLAQTVGTLSLSLRNMLNSEAVEQRTVTLRDLRVGEVNTEEAPRAQPAPRTVPRDPGVAVRVVRGLSTSSQQVMPERSVSRTAQAATTAAAAPTRTAPPRTSPSGAPDLPTAGAVVRDVRPLVPGY